MAEPRDFSHFVRRSEGVARLDLAVEGITCPACLFEIEDGLTALDGVRHARVNLSDRRVRIEWAEGREDPVGAVDRLRAMGYGAHPFDAAEAEAAEAAEARFLLRCLAVAGFATMNVMLLSVSVWSGNASDITPETRDFFHWVSALIALPAAAYAGRPFFRSALAAIRSGRLNMDVPISLGIVLALTLSVIETLHHATHAYFDSAVMLLFFLLLGRFLEQNMRRRTRAVAGNLAALRAETAAKFVSDTEIAEVPVAALAIGDRVLVRQGERISVDGIVAEGRGRVDRSLVTGETAPVAVGPGDEVHAGTLAVAGALTIRVSAAAEGTLLAEVTRLLDGAVEARSRYVRLADRAARLYSPVVHLTALATFAGWMLAGLDWQPSLVIAITVLIITCPCALGLAVPAVQVVAAGALFRRQVLLHSGDAIEKLAEVDTIVFDKTGTLTRPDADVVNARSVAPDLLELAGRLALSSRHPLAAAVARSVGARIPVAGAVEEPGQGVRATLDGREVRIGRPSFCGAEDEAASVSARDPDASLIAVADGDRVAVLAVRQDLRPDAAAVVADLRARGFAIEILSGDRPGPVDRVAGALGIETRHAGVTPAEKIARVEALTAAGRRVLMVGDGLNDAPALAAAHVSMSPVTAVHLSQAAADAVFIGDRLAPVSAALAVAARARRLMRQNLWLAVIYNFIAVPIAIAGLATPLVAAIAMSGSSVIVVANALRARAGEPPAAPESPTGEATRRPVAAARRAAAVEGV